MSSLDAVEPGKPVRSTGFVACKGHWRSEPRGVPPTGDVSDGFVFVGDQYLSFFLTYNNAHKSLGYNSVIAF